ncbi:MAG: hypothetical protein PUI85_01255 [Eubacteriales bacterium]|nr:hypothetical protein [Eubacteriales bacterium]MDY3332983.1 hypothetical protein [Gallibacter sp.]
MNKLELLENNSTKRKELILKKINIMCELQDLLTNKYLIKHDYLINSVNEAVIYKTKRKHDYINEIPVQQEYMERVEKLRNELDDLDQSIKEVFNTTKNLIDSEKYNEKENFIYLDILYKRYIENKSLRSIAGNLYMSKSAVDYKLKKAENILRVSVV